VASALPVVPVAVVPGMVAGLFVGAI